MKFGLILLVLICAFSIIGSLIPQDRSIEWYLNNYPNAGMLIVGLGIPTLYRTWYFVALLGLLVINLALCSIMRFAGINKQKEKSFKAVRELTGRHIIGKENASKLCSYLFSRRYHLAERGNAENENAKNVDSENATEQGIDRTNGAIFYKNTAGYYGSFIVHVSLLLILVLGGAILGLAEKEDYQMLPGETLIFADDTHVTLENFRLTDGTGRTEYASIINITAPGGTEQIRREISVNHPLSYKSFKYYQYSYNFAGTLNAADTRTGGSDLFYLTEQSFFSVDGRSGIWFDALYPGHIINDEGEIVPLIFRGGVRSYPDPVYQIRVSTDGFMHPLLVLPGEIVEVGNIEFEFRDVIPYPGIRIKSNPRFLLELLYASFALMIVGFWLCFFHLPAVIIVRADSYALIDSKTTGAQFEIDSFLDSIKGDK
jgi:cytochrome c biogenesis protein